MLIIRVTHLLFEELIKQANPKKLRSLTLSLTGGGGLRGPPPSGIGDCSKTHLYIDLKVLDFSDISKTKILKKKEIRFFDPPPSEGDTKKMKILKIGRRA